MDASQKIQHRCLSPAAPFGDRSTALSWAFTLIGQVAIKGVLLAAARATALCTPSTLLDRSVLWASKQFESALRQAFQGHPAELFLLSEVETTHAIDGYVDAIGDLEQGPPGVEEAIDPLLRRNPVGGGFPDLSRLPGNVIPEELVERPSPVSAPNSDFDALTALEKRRLAAELLRRKVVGNAVREPESSAIRV
jgi:hypothetical protein